MTQKTKGPVREYALPSALLAAEGAFLIAAHHTTGTTNVAMLICVMLTGVLGLAAAVGTIRRTGGQNCDHQP